MKSVVWDLKCETSDTDDEIWNEFDMWNVKEVAEVWRDEREVWKMFD